MKELVPVKKELSQGGLESLVTAMVHGLAACDIIRRCSRECTGKPAIWFLSGWLDVMWLGDGFMSHRSRAQHLLVQWTGLWLSHCFLKICALRCRFDQKLPPAMRFSF